MSKREGRDKEIKSRFKRFIIISIAFAILLSLLNPSIRAMLTKNVAGVVIGTIVSFLGLFLPSKETKPVYDVPSSENRLIEMWNWALRNNQNTGKVVSVIIGIFAGIVAILASLTP